MHESYPEDALNGSDAASVTRRLPDSADKAPAVVAAWIARIGFAPTALVFAVLMPLPVQGGKSLLGLPSLCVFHLTTGLPCPGCGITRSVVCCCHGRFADSMGYHPLGPVVFAWLLTTAFLRLPLPASWRSRLPAISLKLRAVAGLTLIGLLFAVWGARLAGWLPSPP